MDLLRQLSDQLLKKNQQQLRSEDRSTLLQQIT